MTTYTITNSGSGHSVHASDITGPLELDGNLGGRTVGTLEECQQYINTLRAWSRVIRRGARELAENGMCGKR